MFEWLWPWVWLAAPLPWLLQTLLPPAPNPEPVLQVSFMEELQRLQRQSRARPWRQWRRQCPFAIIWLLLLCAAARPQWLEDNHGHPITGRDMLLAVDFSGSMDTTDMDWHSRPVSRALLVKTLFADFIQGRQGDRLGLILFGTRAYLQAPLTFDKKTVATWLREAFIGIAGQNTAIGDAIGLAIKRLKANPAGQRVLLLITDGADTSSHLPPLTAARLAASQGIKIYCIGVGADPRWPTNLWSSDQLDETLLKHIARLTGGQYFRARNKDDLKTISARIDRLEPSLRNGNPALLGRPLGQWPLGLALVLGMGVGLWRLYRPRLAGRSDQ